MVELVIAGLRLQLGRVSRAEASVADGGDCGQNRASVPTTAQLGRVFQAAAADGVVFALRHSLVGNERVAYTSARTSPPTVAALVITKPP
jgi:hypothetical protein